MTADPEDELEQQEATQERGQDSAPVHGPGGEGLASGCQSPHHLLWFALFNSPTPLTPQAVLKLFSSL